MFLKYEEEKIHSVLKYEKSTCKWTHMVQTRGVQGSAVFGAHGASGERFQKAACTSAS